MNRGAQWAIGTALVAAAWGIAAITPADDANEAAFEVVVDVGEPGIGRNIAVTVTDVQRAESVDAGAWRADGDWLVFDVDAEARQSEFGVALRLATLDIDGTTFRASERPASLFEQALAVGIPRSGSIAFELPSGTTGIATLRLGVNSDPRLDSVIVLTVDLADVAVDSEVELATSDWTNP